MYKEIEEMKESVEDRKELFFFSYTCLRAKKSRSDNVFHKLLQFPYHF